MVVSLYLEEPTPADMARLLEVLCEVDLAYLRKHPRTPRLYRAGVRFQREAPRTEEWRDIPTVLRYGNGDCEDLAAWRCAEWRLAGVGARPMLRSGGRPHLLHAVVLLPDGRVEDPSKRLGLKERG